MGLIAKKAEPSSEDGRRKMKQFIYYNASFIHSFIAQLEDGLPVLRSKEAGNVDSSGLSHSMAKEPSTLKGSIGIPPVVAIEGMTSGDSISSMETKNISESYTEIINQKMDDNIFDHFLEHVFPSGQKESGDFVKIHGNIKMINLSYYSDIIDENFENVIQQVIKPSGKSKRRYIKKGLMEYKRLMRLLLRMMPSNILLLGDEYLAPIEEKFLRDNHKLIPYKFKNPTTLIGKVVGPLNKLNSFDKDLPLLSKLKENIDSIQENLFNLIGVDNKTKVIFPISWYETYENDRIE